MGPALGDYVTGRLAPTIDLDRWIRRERAPWDDFLPFVQALGVATAAWAMLAPTRALLDNPVPAAVWRRLEPDPLRRIYLERWLRCDPARVYAKAPTLARAAFSLALLDSLRDAARAWTAAHRSFRPMPWERPR